MATLKKIEFIEFGPYKIIGKEIKTKHQSFNPVWGSKHETIPSLWKRCFSDGTFDKLIAMEKYFPSETPEGYQGYKRDYCDKDGTFTYLVGFFMKASTPTPDGYVSYNVPACTIARAWIEGEEYDILPNASKLTIDSIKQNGYTLDLQNYFECEVYTDIRFNIPKNNGQKVLVLDYYIPCLKK
ncbi:GyrI-like domain-containing protein [Clostridiaceae bacterium M8S5]|nr:GyrI-like domain-containing protein [Clostridiaceae bacterium M8S5]